MFDGSEQPSGINLAEVPARESLQLQTAREEEQLPSASDQKTHKAEKKGRSRGGQPHYLRGKSPIHLDALHHDPAFHTAQLVVG